MAEDLKHVPGSIGDEFGAVLREKLDRLVVASELVLVCEGWNWRYSRGWELLPYQARFRQAICEAKHALEELSG